VAAATATATKQQKGIFCNAQTQETHSHSQWL